MPKIQAAFTLTAQVPVDVRAVVPTEADRTGMSYPYEGLETYVVATQKKWRCTGVSGESATWEEVGEGGGAGGGSSVSYNASTGVLTIDGTDYTVGDTATSTKLNSLLAGLLSTENAQDVTEKYWIPTSSDQAAISALLNKKLLRLAGSVASQQALLAVTGAEEGDVYIVPNQADDSLTEEWVMLSTGDWQLLGIVSGSVTVSDRAKTASVVSALNSITAEQISGNNYRLVIPVASAGSDGTITMNAATV